MRISDWSSDVCSSDLGLIEGRADRRLLCIVEQLGIDCAPSAIDEPIEFCACGRHQPETVKRGAGRKTRGDLLFELRPVPARDHRHIRDGEQSRSEEHTSELQSLMRNSYAVFCLKKKKNTTTKQNSTRKNTNNSHTYH